MSLCSQPASLVLLAAFFGSSQACIMDPGADSGGEMPRDDPARLSPALQKEREYQERFAQSKIALSLRVVNAAGEPLPGASVALLDSQGQPQGAQRQSDAQGAMRLEGLARRNAFVRVSLTGHYDEWIPVALHRSLEQAQVELGAVQLIKRSPTRMRMTFGGDVMFGRRYYDRDEDGILGEEGDLLFLGSVEQDTRALFRYMQGYLTSDDHSSINLETTLLSQALEGHPKNSIVFHSKAQSASVLGSVGVDSVSLGNNHIFDYLEPGVQSTIETLDRVKIPWFGAGMDLSKARASMRRQVQGEVSVVLQGFSDLTGASYEDPKLRMLATDTPKKAGALAAWSSELERFASDPQLEKDFVVPIIHGGQEYVSVPSSRIQEDLEVSVDAGADFVVAHHPHVPSGIWRYSKAGESALLVGSLGNFVFDQQKFETFFSYLLVVDLVKQGDETAIERMSLVPFAVQDFVPRPITSYAAQSLGRKIASLSSARYMPAREGWQETGLSYAQGRFWVQDAQLKASPQGPVQASRSLTLAPGQSLPIDVRGEDAGGLSFLSRVSSDVPLRCQFGRDLLLGLGRFEDSDVDAQDLEGDNWQWSDYRLVQGHATKHGSGAAALIRNQDQESRVRLPFRSTVAIDPSYPLTLHGWQRSEQSGKLEASIRWRADGGVSIRDDLQEISPASPDAWSPFSVELAPPAESTGLRFAFFLDPNPSKTPATRYLDELSLIEWSGRMVEVGVQGTEPIHAQGWEFMRCWAPESGATVALSFRR